ncbi:dihydrodipicolinate synthase family protein [Streptomyces sp. M19]
MLTDIVRRCLDSGVHGLTRSAAAANSLPVRGPAAGRDREHRRRGGGPGPGRAGVGGFDTASVVRDARDAVAAGSDGVLLAILAYFPLRPAEILGMIGAVTEAVDVPVVLYHHPHLTHVEFSADVIAAAHRDHGVRHVKDASGRITNVARWLDATSGGIRFFSATAVSPPPRCCPARAAGCPARRRPSPPSRWRSTTWPPGESGRRPRRGNGGWTRHSTCSAPSGPAGARRDSSPRSASTWGSPCRRSRRSALTKRP